MVNGRIYTASFGGVAVSAIQDIFEVVAPATSIVVIHAIYLVQTSDFGDAQEEILRLQMTWGFTTSGSGGTALTPRPHMTGFPAAATVVEANNTTQASLGSPVTRHEDAWNIRVGWQYLPPPEDRHIIAPSERFVLELPVAPADAITMSGSITFEEIG